MVLDPKKPGPIPKEALEFFKAKGLKPAFSYRDVWAQEHRRAFTVAKILEADLLKDVQDSLSDALEAGTPFKAWAGKIKDTFDASGWSQYGTEAQEPQRLRTIYDTNLRMARAEGQWERAERTKDALPYFEFNLGPSVKHRPEHEELEGLVLRVDDPWWEKNSPPLDYGCKCFLIQLSAGAAESLGIDDAPNEDYSANGFGYAKGGRDDGLDSALEDVE